MNMKNKINIAELLKDCPMGMELDCTMYNGVSLLSVDNREDITFPIRVIREDGNYIALTKYGQYTNADFAKCVIFPKGKTTWAGFRKLFKDGDVLSYQCSGFENRSIYIYMYHPRMNTTYYVALSGDSDSRFMINDKKGHALNSYNDTVRFATEEEKQKLFSAIKANGYKWNAETKTLEKLIVPKFKVGDIIKRKDAEYNFSVIITEFDGDYYDCVNDDAQCGTIYIESQDEWELVPNKFDITTLKPFESRVLVRDKNTDEWRGHFFSHHNNNYDRPYICIGVEGINEYKKCIPFEGNEHLLGKTDDCNDYYKTWE